MSGNHDNGIATASSTAAPKVRLPSSTIGPATAVPKKITLNRISDKMKSAVIAIVLSLPKFVRPITIQRIINAPITKAHIQSPVCNKPSAASAPS